MIGTPRRIEVLILDAVRPLNVTVLLGLVTVIALLMPAGPVAQVTAITGIVVLVGTFAERRLCGGGIPLLQRLVISIGFGLFAILGVGAVVGLALPSLGVAHPLSRAPLLIVWCVILAGVVVASATRGFDPVRDAFHGLRPTHAVWTFVLVLPPLLALVGVTRLNVAGQSTIAIISGVLVVLLVALAVGLPTTTKGPPRVLLLASALVTAAWQSPFRGGWLAGWDIQHEYYVATLAVRQAVFPLTHFTDAYGGMLSLTVWPAQLHALTGMNLRTVLALPPSLALGVCLVVTWCTLRERIGERSSALLCALFVISAPMLDTLPTVTRQSYAVLFFTLLIMAVTSRRLQPRAAQVLACVAGLGLAMTHYSSAYLAAGAVLMGWLLTLVFRPKKGTKVLTLPVTAVVVGAAVLWGGFVAKTGSNFRQILASIRADGLQLLPGSGSVLTRWLKASAIYQSFNAKVIHATDLELRFHSYNWMSVDPRAYAVPIVNSPPPVAHGIPVLGFLLATGGTTLAELLVFAALAAVFYCLWLCHRDHRLAGLVGMALAGFAISGLSRLSQTFAVNFGTSRVQVEMYLIFVVTVGVTFEGAAVVRRLESARRFAHRWRAAGTLAAVLAASLAVATSMQLVNLAESNGELLAAFSTSLSPLQTVSSPDLLAARFIAVHRPSTLLVQSDYYAQLSLLDYGFTDRPNFITSVDPVIVDNTSWVFANRTNIVFGRAAGGNNTEIGWFRFPYTYFVATRSILYVSPTDVVFGGNSLSLYSPTLPVAAP